MPLPFTARIPLEGLDDNGDALTTEFETTVVDRWERRSDASLMRVKASTCPDQTSHVVVNVEKREPKLELKPQLAVTRNFIRWGA